MRIRSIKPEFWRSDSINDLGHFDRLFFIGLWSYADDNGVGRDHVVNIAADLFAGDLSRDSRETLARVSESLSTLEKQNLIVRYTVEGEKYLAITTWKKHQRIDKPNKPRYPEPVATQGVSETLARVSETLARVSEKEPSGTEEQRNRGTEEQLFRSEKSDPPKKPKQHHEQSQRLCELLAEKIKGDGGLGKISESALKACDSLIVIDGRTPEQIEWLINWAWDPHNWWHGKIMSMSKLREKFDQLVIEAKKDRTKQAQANQDGLKAVLSRRTAA